MNSFIIKDKSFYQKLLAIAIPMAVQNLINIAVNLLDTIMLGQLGEVAMSASRPTFRRFLWQHQKNYITKNAVNYW